MSDEEKPFIGDEYNNDLLSVSYKIIPGSELNVDRQCDAVVKPKATGKKKTEASRQSEKNYTVVSYGPIKVRVSHRSTPTLLSGRRSKFFPLEGEEARKRELKREKNRRTATKLKERQIKIQSQLTNELGELQAKEKDLLEKINNLQSYKEFLEDRFRRLFLDACQTLPAASSSDDSTQVQTETAKTVEREVKRVKTEPRSPSPNWQLVFSI